MEFNYSKLRGKIVEKYETIENFALAMGQTTASLSLKLSNKRQFTQKDIIKAKKLLGLTKVDEYFFST